MEDYAIEWLRNLIRRERRGCRQLLSAIGPKPQMSRVDQVGWHTDSPTAQP